MARAVGILLMLICAISCKRNKELSVQLLPNPAPSGSITPNETVTPDGSVLLSWLERVNEGLALRFSIRGAKEWSTPQTVVARKNFDTYAEAPPWVLMLPNRSLVSVWTEKLPPVNGHPSEGDYLYISASSDSGKTWTPPAIVHSARNDGEHSFASLAVDNHDHANIVWLDSRDYETKHTYRLMSTLIASSGTIGDEQTVDDDVCTCCPTGLVKTSAGLLAAYRNHTKEEIRDIYTVREESGKWQPGTSLNNDGWHFNGCPVNGAALAQKGDEVAVAWYTGIEEKSSLQVAFSNDNGATFPVIKKVDGGRGESRPMGRPTLAFSGSGSVLVVWMIHENGSSRLVAAQVQRQNAETRRVELAEGGAESLGYPRMQIAGSAALVSWGGAGDSKTVRTALLSLR